MSKHILLIQGHPDRAAPHFGHALAAAYAEGAAAGGHRLSRVEVAALDFPLLRSQAEWESGPLPPGLAACSGALGDADHLVIFFPLWLGGQPALLKGFFEQLLRPGIGAPKEKTLPLRGKSARVVVTMGMPAWFYRLRYRAQGVATLEDNVLRFCGMAPVRRSLIGGVEALSASARAAWLERMKALGRAAR